MSQEILDCDALLDEQESESLKVRQSIELEASGLALSKAKIIYSILRGEFISSSKDAKRNEKIKIVTWIDTDIVIKDSLCNEWCINALLDSLKGSLVEKWYDVKVKKDIWAILLYQSVPIEISIPQWKLESRKIPWNIKRIDPSRLDETEKIVQLHVVKKSEISELAAS
ncbi:MAG: hypothetical protein ACD_2C00079G0005 [uncultured bacterium (gcode 4)]|uniref:Uncharacterized protein n=1 Tax=uncultured bacterium (gcode 4) TaxID=1234023 RepID=K2G3Q6_9BACT|nr:MAG: hypothetical protein ACD_2C00079G0005 [uncultured bacterium (gcode 4)]